MAIGFMNSHLAITVQCSDDRAKQWYDWFGVADRNYFWLAETIYQNETETTLAATASTATSNMSSSFAYRTKTGRNRGYVTVRQMTKGETDELQNDRITWFLESKLPAN